MDTDEQKRFSTLGGVSLHQTFFFSPDFGY